MYHLASGVNHTSWYKPLLVCTTVNGVNHVSWCKPLWVFTMAGSVDHASWCRPLWVYTMAGGVDHFCVLSIRFLLPASASCLLNASLAPLLNAFHGVYTKHYLHHQRLSEAVVLRLNNSDERNLCISKSAMHNKGYYGIFTVDMRSKDFQHPFLTWR